MRSGGPATVILLLSVVGLIVTARPAPADPLSDLATQATALVTQLEASSESITALGQQYDAAQLALEQAQQAAQNDRSGLTVLAPRIASLQHQIDERAASDYEASTVGQLLGPLDLHEAEQLTIRDRYAADQAEQETSTLQLLRAEQRTFARDQRDAEQAEANEQTDLQQLTALKAQLQIANARQVQLLSQVQGQLALVAPSAEEAELDAQLSLALAEFDPGGVGGSASVFPNLPPVSGAAAVAIAYARAQLGKPYLYAAAGPDSFDCSGLVMAAYGFAGIRLPHYSGAQYALLPHVPLLAMQPGDLVFWGPGGSEHVAIYVGAGRILEAGGTGDNVHIGPIWGHPVGAARVVV